MKKIPIFIISLFLASSFFSIKVFAETSPDQCPTTNPAKTVECVTGKHYAGGQCRLDSIIQTQITTCQTSGKNEAYSCSIHSPCVCAPGYPVDCRSKAPGVCLAAPMPVNPVCTAQGKTTTECGECGSIIPCSAGYERGTDNECYPIDEFGLFEKLTDLIYSTNLFAESLIGPKTTIFDGIIANITANASYYFLTPTNATGTEYKYGMTGDPTDLLLLEADYADEAGTAATASTIDITGGTAGQVLTINVTEDGTEWADAIDITGGTAGQVLTINATEDDTEWTTPATGGGVQAVFAGLSATPRDGNDILGYKNVANECAAYGAGSHVCTLDEIAHSYVTQAAGTGIYLATGNAWINNGPPGYTSNIVNDCNGWNTASPAIFGSVWKFDTDYSMITPCNMALKFTCCK